MDYYKFDIVGVELIQEQGYNYLLKITNNKRLANFILNCEKNKGVRNFKEFYNDIIIGRIDEVQLEKNLFEENFDYILIQERRRKLKNIF